jgi:TRAP-type C4-dicarboxylate transport system permease small subunit
MQQPTPEHQTVQWLGGIFAAVAVAAFLVMFGSMVLAVAARYLNITGLDWAYEVTAYSFIWVTFVGAIVAEAWGENVAFSALRGLLPPRAQRVFSIINELCLALVGCVVTVSCAMLFWKFGNVHSPMLRIPRGVVVAALLVLGVSVVLIAAIRIRERFRSKAVPPPPTGIPL